MQGNPLREYIRIHGGRMEVNVGDEWQAIFIEKPLAKTNGCFKAFDSDMVKLNEVIENLTASDPNEMSPSRKMCPLPQSRNRSKVKILL